MGKRKSRTKPPPKKKMDKLEAVFNCPFCNHEKSVDYTLDKRCMTATVGCRICHEAYSTIPNNLTEPVDVYSEWLDECERVNDIDEPAP